MTHATSLSSGAVLRRAVHRGLCGLALAALAGSALTVAATSSQRTAAVADIGGPAHDPSSAPIVFIPGLLGSELGCAPGSLPPLNLWPGVAEQTELSWTQYFPDLGLVNVVEADGSLTSRTEASDVYPAGCGREPFGAGEAAAHEPRPLRPTWCTPERRFDQDGPFASCPVIGASGAYNTFGYALEQAAARTGQQVLFHAWDWRKSPVDQAADLAATIAELATDSGVKATVVAHSFGNNLFRAVVDEFEAQGVEAGRYIGRFLSVAAPWWGVATAWEHAAFGSLQPGFWADVLALIVGPDEVQEVFASSPGPYHLFPTPMFDDFVAERRGADEHWLAAPKRDADLTEWIPPGEVGAVVGDQMDSCPDAQAIPCASEQLYELAASGFPATGFDTSGIADWAAIVGSGIGTALQICSGCLTWPDGSTDGEAIRTDVAGNPVVEHRIRTIDGDGNVPVFSAIQGSDPFRPPGDDVPFYFTCGIDHMDLMKLESVLEQTIPYLTDTTTLSYGGVFSRLPRGVGDCPAFPSDGRDWYVQSDALVPAQRRSLERPSIASAENLAPAVRLGRQMR